MKRAILVLGPESSGTRLVTRMLVEAGCKGNADHYQWFDDHEFEGSPVVWRRSFPHGKRWPDLARMQGRLAEAGYSTSAIVVVREHHSNVQSSVYRGRTPDRLLASVTVQQGFLRLFRELDRTGMPFVVLTYEAICAGPEQMQEWLSEAFGLPGVSRVEVEDGNRKWRGPATN